MRSHKNPIKKFAFLCLGWKKKKKEKRKQDVAPKGEHGRADQKKKNQNGKGKRKNACGKLFVK